MATHSSILAWKIPWTEEPGELHTVHGIEESQARLSVHDISQCRLSHLWIGGCFWVAGTNFPVKSGLTSSKEV